DLEADPAQPRHQRADGGGADHEEAAHRIGQVGAQHQRRQPRRQRDRRRRRDERRAIDLRRSGRRRHHPRHLPGGRPAYAHRCAARRDAALFHRDHPRRQQCRRQARRAGAAALRCRAGPRHGLDRGDHSGQPRARHAAAGGARPADPQAQGGRRGCGGRSARLSAVPAAAV
ncbi:hypothetical protein LTR94_027807, partial [Friedmanniomyces endolithicus]